MVFVIQLVENISNYCKPIQFILMKKNTQM